MDRHFSNGKLLLTSEYFVLDGALALTIPTRMGQEFLAEEIDDNKGTIYWTALHQGEFWLEIEIDYLKWKVNKTNLPESADFVMKTLMNVQKLSSKHLQNKKSYRIKTNLEFPLHYGWGSSSTLMANLAKWAEIDAFELNEKSLGGSGYDVALAMKGTSILYQLKGREREVREICFSPEFREELLFVHLNQKQDSREGIKLYKSIPKSQELIEYFSDLTEKVLLCQDLEGFSGLMEMHEDKVSSFLGLSKVKQECFPDCPVFVKSLGAWGGDFVMTRKFIDYQGYFQGRGFHSFFDWEEIIK